MSSGDSRNGCEDERAIPTSIGFVLMRSSGIPSPYVHVQRLRRPE